MPSREFNKPFWSVRAIEATPGGIYVGGSFNLADGKSANSVAEWDGLGWSALGTGVANGVNGGVHALEVIGNELFVGGEFSAAGGILATNIARWDGFNWYPLGPGARGGIRALASVGKSLFAGGDNVGQLYVSIASWNGTTWAALTGSSGESMRAGVYALATNGANLYVVGSGGPEGIVAPTTIRVS